MFQHKCQGLPGSSEIEVSLSSRCCSKTSLAIADSAESQLEAYQQPFWQTLVLPPGKLGVKVKFEMKGLVQP